jgi:hypothetical protein
LFWLQSGLKSARLAAGRSELPECLSAAHQAAAGKHDVSDEDNPHRGKWNKRKNAKSGKKADNGDDKGNDKNNLRRRTEIHVRILLNMIRTAAYYQARGRTPIRARGAVEYPFAQGRFRATYSKRVATRLDLLFSGRDADGIRFAGPDTLDL